MVPPVITSGAAYARVAINESVMALPESDGVYYGAPMGLNPEAAHVRMDLFEEAGYSDFPATWEEFIELNDTLAAAGVTPMSVGGLDAWMMPIVHDILGSAQYGGSELESAVLAASGKPAAVAEMRPANAATASGTSAKSISPF